MICRSTCLPALLGLFLFGCGGGVVTPAMVGAAQKRWPDASAEAGRLPSNGSVLTTNVPSSARCTIASL